MISGFNASLSGLNAASTRLGVSAQNIANPTAAPVQATQTSNPQGGAEVSVSQTPDGTPNDTETQLVNTITASYDYKANLKPIQVQDDLLKSTLDIIS